MRVCLRLARLLSSFALVMILLAAGGEEAFAQRTRTGTSRTATKTKRADTGKKATPARSAPSRTRSAPSRATPSRGSASRGSQGRTTPSRATPTRESRATPTRGSQTRTSSTRAGQSRSGSAGSTRATQRATPTSQSRTTGSRGATRSTATGASRGTGSTGVRNGGTRGTGSTGVRNGGTRGTGSTGVRSGGTRGTGSTGVRSGGTRNTGSTGVRNGGTRNTGSTGVRNGGTRGNGQGGRIERNRQPRHGPGSRADSRVRGNRSLLRDNRRNGRRVHIPSRRWNYRRPAYRVPRYSRAQLRIYRPRIHVDIYWPWVVRHHRHWRPVYRYRQVVKVETVVYGRPSRAEVEVETVYSHEVVHANDEFAEIDVRIERLELFQGGQFLGYVDRLPSDLSQMTATVYRNGEVYFDREIFLLGDPYAGFEVVSTRSYDGYVLDAYHHTDGYRAGSVDLRNHRVRSRKSSRLFRPNRADSHVPISLLPNDEGWLWDYGIDAISATVDDYDWYYGGQRTSMTQPSTGWSQQDAWDYQTDSGAEIKFERNSQIRRVQ